MEECFPSKTIPNTKTTSPFTTDVPVSTPPQTTASGSVPSTTINQNLVHVPPNVQYVAVPSSPVQHVAVPSSPVQHGFMPMIAQVSTIFTSKLKGFITLKAVVLY